LDGLNYPSLIQELLEPMGVVVLHSTIDGGSSAPYDYLSQPLFKKIIGSNGNLIRDGRKALYQYVQNLERKARRASNCLSAYIMPIAIIWFKSDPLYFPDVCDKKKSRYDMLALIIFAKKSVKCSSANMSSTLTLRS